MGWVCGGRGGRRKGGRGTSRAFGAQVCWSSRPGAGVGPGVRSTGTTTATRSVCLHSRPAFGQNRTQPTFVPPPPPDSGATPLSLARRPPCRCSQQAYSAAPRRCQHHCSTYNNNNTTHLLQLLTHTTHHTTAWIPLPPCCRTAQQIPRLHPTRLPLQCCCVPVGAPGQPRAA